jgi:hypothetical protein
MDLLILTIVVLLIVIVVQRARFSSLLDEKTNEIEKMRDINHVLVGKLFDAKNEVKTIKMLLGKQL